MSARPQFTHDELLRQIIRRPATKFIVVEGAGDIPIYSSILYSSVADGLGGDWEIIEAQGKEKIVEYLSQNSNNNFRCIMDLDFDDENGADYRVVTLKRYSIENYFICDHVLSLCLSVPLRISPKEIILDLDFFGFVEQMNKQANYLMKVCFYYHRVVSPNIAEDKLSWSDDCIFVKNNGDSWELCECSIQGIIKKLNPENVSGEAIEEYFQNNFRSGGCVTHYLPGKMLIEPLRRFVRQYYRARKRKGGSQFNSLDSFMGVIIGNLASSASLRDELRPIVEFIKN